MILKHKLAIYSRQHPAASLPQVLIVHDVQLSPNMYKNIQLPFFKTSWLPNSTNGHGQPAVEELPLPQRNIAAQSPAPCAAVLVQAAKLVVHAALAQNLPQTETATHNTAAPGRRPTTGQQLQFHTQHSSSWEEAYHRTAAAICSSPCQ